MSPWAEFDAAHIPGAVSLPLSQLWFRMTSISEDPAVPVLVYDSEGRRSRQGALLLKAEYFRHVGHLPGGLKAWREAGLPVRRREASP